MVWYICFLTLSLQKQKVVFLVHSPFPSIQYLPEATEEEEKKLALLFLDHGLAVAPGASFYTKELGWFRLLFSVPKERTYRG